MKSAEKPVPFVSVVLAVRNEAHWITKTLEAVAKQDYPPERLEVLIADGRSEDNTRQLLDAFIFGRPNFRRIDNPGKIVACGLNAAIRQSKGEIIVRVDGHTLIEKDYVSQCVKALEETGADNVGGRMNSSGSSWQSRTLALAASSPFGIGNAHFHYSLERRWVDTVYLGAWRRSTLLKYGLFDEELVRNQDDELNYRIRAGGGKILLIPEIRSTYFARTSFGAAFSQYFQYGFWKVRVLQKHFRQMKLRQFVPGVFIAVLFSLSAAAPFFESAGNLLALLILAYLISALTAAVRLRPGLSGLLGLPAAFFILHAAYGLGFWAGIAAFARSWGKGCGKVPRLEA